MRASVEGNCHSLLLFISAQLRTASDSTFWCDEPQKLRCLKEEIYDEILCYCPVISALCHFPRVFQGYLRSLNFFIP